MVEARKKKAAEIKANKAQEPEKPKNKVGRPTTTIIKEKIIYMAPQADGSYAPMKMKKPTAREIKAFDNEQEVKAKEDETGVKLKRRVNGKADKRSTCGNRTPAQIEAAKKLAQLAKDRAAAKRKAKEDSKKADKEEFKNEIAETIIDVVSKPIEKIKEERKQRKPVLTEEQKKAYQFKKQKDLFS